MKPLLVGESYRGDACLSADTDSGRRLYRQVLRVSATRYEEEYCRTNLCGAAWDDGAAERRAVVLLLNAAYRMGPARMVMLGRRVSSAFAAALGMRSELLAANTSSTFGDVVLVSIHHPSGRCREWNDPGAYAAARRALRDGGCLR